MKSPRILNRMRAIGAILLQAWIGGAVGYAVVRFFPAAFAKIPLQLTIVVIGVGAIAGGLIAWKSLSFQSYAWVPLIESQLPTALRNLCERHTPDMVELGFKELGDYQLRSYPMKINVRLFLSDDGMTVGLLEQVLGHVAVSFTTVFSDASALETSNLSMMGNSIPVGLTKKGSYLRFNLQPSASVDSTFASHIEEVSKLCGTDELEVMTFDADNCRTAIDHINRINYHQMFEEGVVLQRPHLRVARSGRNHIRLDTNALGLATGALMWFAHDCRTTFCNSRGR